MRKSRIKYLFIHTNGVYYARKTVPKQYRNLKLPRELWESLDCKTLDEALIRLGPALERFNARIAGAIAAANDNISEEVVRLDAVANGSSYYLQSQIVEAPPRQSIAMLSQGIAEILTMKKPSPVTVARIGGAIGSNGMTMRQALEKFELECTDVTREMNDRHRDKYFAKYRQAVGEWEQWERTTGTEHDVLNVRKQSVIDFRTQLLARDGEAKLKLDTIVKKVMWLRHIVRNTYDAFQMGESPFENLRPIKRASDVEKRNPFLEPEILPVREKLEQDASDEIQAIVAVLENTGARPGEIVGLHPEDICIDAEIPHIKIRPNKTRTLKNVPSKREIPLVGRALDAMQRYPSGFPSYCRPGGSDAFSSAVNKHIKEVVEDRTSYSYRHRMADLMKHHKVNDSLKAGIAGHAGGMNAYYGGVYPLEIMQETLIKILPDYAY